MSIERAERVQVKFFATNPEPVDAVALIPVFHRWIREGVLTDELAIDVADYSHVHQGPGVVLIGHGADYYYDLGAGRAGLLYSRKRGLDGDLETLLRDALRRAIAACKTLESEGIGLTFGTKEVLVRVPDRLHAPNDDTSYEALQTLLQSVLSDELGAAPKLEREVRRGGPLGARAQL